MPLTGPGEQRPAVEGARLKYSAVPREIQQWVEETTKSEVILAISQRGGLSPGCASQLTLRNGSRIFIKACGVNINADSFRRLREESYVMATMKESRHRPRLLDVFDDGRWIAHLQSFVPGRHARLDKPEEAQRIWDCVAEQSAELTPPPSDLVIKELRTSAQGWVREWKTIVNMPGMYLPTWAAAQSKELFQRIQVLPEKLPPQTLCHWDLRGDNIIISADGNVTVADWGMARIGPKWADLFSLSLEWAHLKSFDDLCYTLVNNFPVNDSTLTDLLIALAGVKSLASRANARSGMPTYKHFAATTASRYFSALERRLS